MKIKPVTRAKPCGFPSHAEIRADRQNGTSNDVPGNPFPLAVLLGLAALLQPEQTEAADAKDTIVLPLDKTPDGGQTIIEEAASAVAPLLEEAMENDGRGSFGCISVSPGRFMPEDEAVELIRKELEAAGLHLQKDVVLNGVLAPTIKTPAEIQPRPVRFDLADPGRGIFIDFIGQWDSGSWGERGGLGWSVDLSEIAQRAAKAYGAFDGKSNTTFGIFFDPIADDGIEFAYYMGLPEDMRERARAEYEKREKKIKWDKAKYRLNLQVQHFIEYLREQGVLPEQAE